MNIVNSGGRYVIYGEDVQTYKSLPADTYAVGFDQMSGYYLVHHNDLTMGEKVYGPYATKVTKVMDTFQTFERNMGIILSGPKGVGKSVFARLLAEEGKKHNLPLIIISHDSPGLPEFISSIQQECIILFDEFEKVFASGDMNRMRPADDSPDRVAAQDRLLSLFDGIDDGKKLYVITCNDVRDLSTYLLNRPGRFHYHFMLNTPTGDEIREYLTDNLNDNAKQYISEIVALSSMSSFTYDVLRALVFELNRGYPLDETLQDLNIERERRLLLSIKVKFTNGITVTSERPECFELGDSSKFFQWFELPVKAVPPEIYAYCHSLRISFPVNELVIDEKGCSVDPMCVEVYFDPDDLKYADVDNIDQLTAMTKEFTDSFQIESITFEKSSSYLQQMGLRKFSSYNISRGW